MAKICSSELDGRIITILLLSNYEITSSTPPTATGGRGGIIHPGGSKTPPGLGVVAGGSAGAEGALLAMTAADRGSARTDHRFDLLL
jgi:hypothetical protein